MYLAQCKVSLKHTIWPMLYVCHATLHTVQYKLEYSLCCLGLSLCTVYDSVYSVSGLSLCTVYDSVIVEGGCTMLYILCAGAGRYRCGWSSTSSINGLSP